MLTVNMENMAPAVWMLLFTHCEIFENYEIICRPGFDSHKWYVCFKYHIFTSLVCILVWFSVCVRGGQVGEGQPLLNRYPLFNVQKKKK